jgi:hypothetical protein
MSLLDLRVVGFGIDQQFFQLCRALGISDIAAIAGHGVLGFKVH